jgi:hypothetical protein
MCGNLARARGAPNDCVKCGAVDSYQAAPPQPAVSTCPTCGRALDSKG